MSDQEILDLIHKLPDKAAFLNYLRGLEASPEQPPACPPGDGE